MVESAQHAVAASVAAGPGTLQQHRARLAWSDPCRRSWLLQLAPSVLLIPAPGSTGHLRENLAAEHVALDDEALRELAGVGVWPS